MPPRIRRWPNWCARSRISASRSTRSSARSTMCCRCRRASATKRASRRSTPRSIRCAPNAIKARQEISQRFPAYADLVDPKPPSVEQIKATLATARRCCRSISAATQQFRLGGAEGRPGRVRRDQGDERRARKQGSQAARGARAAGGDDLRHSGVRSQARAMSSTRCCCKPVESGWKPAKNLIVVTNGALGLLPLSLLPTAPARDRSDDDPLFASYRNVPWLARTHAVTMVPSAAALRTLRQLPPGKPDARRTDRVRRSVSSARSRQAEAAQRRQASGSPMPAATRTRGMSAEAAQQRRSSKASTAPSWRCCRGFRIRPTS